MMNERSIPFDTLRTIAIIFVVGIHTSGQYVEHFLPESGSYLLALAVQAVVQPGVPLFVLLSGAFIAGRAPYSWKAYYSKRLPRLLLPLAVWLPLYYLWFWFKGDDMGRLLYELPQGGGFLHLWFLVMLISLYTLVPLFDEILRRIRSPKHLYLFGFLLLLFGMVGHGADVLNGNRIFFPLYYLYYSGYFVLGYVLHKHPPHNLSGSFLCFVLASAGLFVGTFYTQSQWGSRYPLENLSPLIALSAISLFALFASPGSSGMRANTLSRISPFVMGIYILHIAVLNIVTKPFLVFLPRIMHCAGASIGIRLPLTFLLSYILVRLLIRLPFCRRILL